MKFRFAVFLALLLVLVQAYPAMASWGHSLRVVPSAEPNRDRNANWLQVSREGSHTLTVFATHCAVSVNLNVLSPEPLALTL
jgi:hypothetical protein